MVTQADRDPPLFARPMLSVKIKPDLSIQKSNDEGTKEAPTNLLSSQ
jgi:hypothetical protein